MMGHWRDWQGEVDADLVTLQRVAGDAAGTALDPPKVLDPFPPSGHYRIEVADTATTGVDLSVSIYCPNGEMGENDWFLYYRHMDQTEGAFNSIKTSQSNHYI